VDLPVFGVENGNVFRWKIDSLVSQKYNRIFHKSVSPNTSFSLPKDAFNRRS